MLKGQGGAQFVLDANGVAVGLTGQPNVTTPIVPTNRQIEDQFRQALSQFIASATPVVVETAPTKQLTGAVYYIDSISGSDAANGLTPATAWQNATKINSGLAPAAGSTIHFADDCVFDYADTLATYVARTKFASNSADGLRGTTAQPIVIKTYPARPTTTKQKPIFRYYADIVSGDWTSESGNTVGGVVLGPNVYSIPWAVAGFTTDTDIGVAFGASQQTLGIARRQGGAGVYGNTAGQLLQDRDYAVANSKIFVYSTGSNPTVNFGRVCVFGIPLFSSSWQGLHNTKITGLRFELAKMSNLTHGSATVNGVRGFECYNCEFDRSYVGYFNSAGTAASASEMEVTFHDNHITNCPGSAIRLGITGTAQANTLSWRVYGNTIRGGNLSHSLGGGFLYVQSTGGTYHHAWNNYGYDCRNGTGGNNIDGAFIYTDYKCQKANIVQNIAERCGVAFQHNLSIGVVNQGNLAIDCVTYAQVTGATGTAGVAGQTYTLAHNTWLWTGRVTMASIPMGTGLGALATRPVIHEYNDDFAANLFSKFSAVNNLAVSLAAETSARQMLSYNASKITTPLVAGCAMIGLSNIVVYDSGTSTDMSATAGNVAAVAAIADVATWMPGAAGGNARIAKDSLIAGIGAPLAVQYQDIAGKNFGFRPTPGCYEPQTAPGGAVGQIVTATIASGAAVSLTTATAADVTSIVVPAGTWSITRQVDFILTGASATNFKSGPTLTSVTLPTQAGGSGLGTDALASTPLITTTVSDMYMQSGPPVTLTVTVDTTLYLDAQATFSAGTVTAYGTISAQRIS